MMHSVGHTRDGRSVIGRWLAAALCLTALGPHPVAHCHADLLHQPAGSEILAHHLQVCHGCGGNDALPPADAVHFHWEFSTALPSAGGSASWGAVGVLPAGQLSACESSCLESLRWLVATQPANASVHCNVLSAPFDRPASGPDSVPGRVRCIQMCLLLC
ncbi:MAG: hypothetical protein D6753_09555 [Planctomycetota bacterium]|nr:MAG: hypothetical protein D6753_09555 [Planctomycetota bacterium]